MKTIVRSLSRWFLLLALALGLFSLFYFDLHQYLRIDTLKTYQITAEEWTQKHYFYALALYVLVYTLLIACTVPCASLLALIGGFLFGSVAVLYAVFATTLGGTLLFFAIRTAIGAQIAKRKDGWIKKMEHGFKRNAFNYILMMRLVPVFPCWLSNISAGALNVPYNTFVTATLIGIFPATFIYVMAGRGLDELLSSEVDLQLLFSPTIAFPLLGLAVISISPIIYKMIKKPAQKS